MTTSETPQITICMVTFGALRWVRESIEALRAHTTIPHQLVVVDNGSNDGTLDWLRANLHAGELIENPINSGFSGGNNLAVNAAIAPLLCLLNSDAIVGPSWLEPLIAALENDPTAGIAVPILLNLDGSVQEAGCNIDSDGRAEPMFAGRKLEDLNRSTQRTVPYGSAACWVLRTATYRDLGGFDCGYGKAFYEDVDFAFALAEAGFRTTLVPAVAIVHAQGASAGDRTRAESLRSTQQTRFVRRHQSQLATRWHIYDLEREPHRFHAARDIGATQRTLVVDLEHNTLTSTTEGTSEGISEGAIAPYEQIRQFLRDRLFMFTTVRAPGSWCDAHAPLIAKYQPQATIERL